MKVDIGYPYNTNLIVSTASGMLMFSAELLRENLTPANEKKKPSMSQNEETWWKMVENNYR